MYFFLRLLRRKAVIKGTSDVPGALSGVPCSPLTTPVMAFKNLFCASRFTVTKRALSQGGEVRHLVWLMTKRTRVQIPSLLFRRLHYAGGAHKNIQCSVMFHVQTSLTSICIVHGLIRDSYVCVRKE